VSFHWKLTDTKASNPLMDVCDNDVSIKFIVNRFHFVNIVNVEGIINISSSGRNWEVDDFLFHGIVLQNLNEMKQF
jgi:hypothetical protein